MDSYDDPTALRDVRKPEAPEALAAGVATAQAGTNGTAVQGGGSERHAASRMPSLESSIRHCPAGEAIEILQEKWVLHIVHALLGGPKGFNELGREVGGCNPTTLTQRLSRLEAIGVLRKDVHSQLPPRCSYSLTDAGRGLERVITAIRAWALTHLTGERREPGA